jgi:Domain of unknown function (DUF6265)
MKTARALCFALILLAAPILAAEPQAPPAAEAPKATVADFSWIAGAWQGEIGGDFFDEQWTPPAGGAMLGMFRWIKKDGRVVIYELLALEPAGESVVLQLRHLKPGLVALEDKDGALAFYLVSYRPGEAVFDNRNPDKPIRIGYRKQGEDLIATLDRVENGKPSTLEFRYHRR